MTPSNVLTAETSGPAQRWSIPEFSMPVNAPPTAAALENLAAAARDEGFAQGCREGFDKGVADARALAQRLSGIMDQLARPLSAIDADVERMMVGLCLQIGNRLTLNALRADPTQVAGIVHEAVRLLTPPPREVRVRLHPDDLAAVRTVLFADTMPQWLLEADATLARGDCLIATDVAAVDGRMESRLAEIARNLFNES